VAAPAREPCQPASALCLQPVDVPAEGHEVVAESGIVYAVDVLRGDGVDRHPDAGDHRSLAARRSPLVDPYRVV
jgi:hypothetical protein